MHITNMCMYLLGFWTEVVDRFDHEVKSRVLSVFDVNIAAFLITAV